MVPAGKASVGHAPLVGQLPGFIPPHVYGRGAVTVHLLIVAPSTEVQRVPGYFTLH